MDITLRQDWSVTIYSASIVLTAKGWWWMEMAVCLST